MLMNNLFTSVSKDKQALDGGESVRTLVVALAVSTVALAAWPPSQAAAPSPSSRWAREYRRWTRITPKPVPLLTQIATLCAAPGSVDSNPHHAYQFRVYANAVARKAMLGQKKPAFPAGSVIVKEKLGSEDAAAQPVLLTVMTRSKSGKGQTGDWAYHVLKADGTQVPGKTDHCQRCHQKARDNDFVFRTYLSPGQLAGLR
jgi:hypothetical protein